MFAISAKYQFRHENLTSATREPQYLQDEYDGLADKLWEMSTPI